MDEVNCRKGDVSNTQVVSLATETTLNNTGLMFSDGANMLASADLALDDSGTTYVTLPLHLLQDGSILDSGSGVHNLILKNLASNTVYLDTSQLTLLSGGSSQVILSTDGLVEDGDGKIILDAENADKNSNKISVIPGLGVDISTIDLTNLSGEGGSGDVVSDPTENGEVTKRGCLTFDLPTAISPPSASKQNHQVHQRTSSRRGPGRPRREDTEVDPPIGKGPFKCPICGKEFSKSSQFKRHVKCHSDDKPFLCNLCSSSFNVESNLILHKATHNVDDPRCPECNKKFSRIASLKAHVMLHEKEESLFCSECGDEFSTIAQLEEHKKEHQNEWVKPSTPQCRQCKWQFSRASALREHMKEHYKVKASLSHKSHKRNIDRSTFIHKCDTCHKCFQKPSQLVRHKRIHTGERPYKCQLCSRAFNQKGSLQIHMSKHNGIKPFHCEFCAAAFSQKGNLRAHIVRVHTIPNSGEQVYKCMECPCVFKKLGSLNAHMSRMHCGDGTQKIDGSDTSDTSHMVNVRAVLSQLAELQADVAGDKSKMPDQPSDADILQQALVNSGLSGKDQSALRGLQDGSSKQESKMKGDVSGDTGAVRPHKDSSTTSYITLADRGLDGTVRRYIIRQRRVGTVRWHQCSYCTKEFKKPSDLVRHIRIHTHERPYKCTHCFRSFAVKSTLTAHIRTHTGVRDHVCYMCLKKFSSASSLKVHIRMHTGTKPFACELCDKTFRTTGHQKTHMLSHAKESSGTSEERIARRKLVRQKPTLPALPEVALQEPIIITTNGFVQAVARNSTVFLPGNTVSLDRPYMCNVCNAAFRKLSHLKQHIRMHTGERPYKCTLCDRHFISNGVLKAHQRTHEGVKSYKCPECSNMFSTNGSLKRHMGTHSDVRPFMCPYCHKTFKTSVNCRKHIKTHKHELALQVAQQTAKEEGTNILSTIPVNGQGPAVVTESTNFPPEGLGPDFAQAFSDQPFQVASTTEQQEQEESTFAQNTLVHTLASGPLGDGTDPVTAPGVITHTLHADATGTITLPSLVGQHTLTQESIREIERTLNEQIFGTSATVTSDVVNVGGASSDLATRVEVGGSDSEVESTTTEDLARTLGASTSPSAQPDSSALGTLSEGQKDDNRNKNPAEPSGNSSVFGTTFDSAGFESCVFSAITLQSDPLELEGLGSGSSMTTNMASILPPSGDPVPEPQSSTTADTTSKPEPSVMSPMDGPVAAAAAVVADDAEKDKNYVPGRPFISDAPPGERPFKCKQCSRAFKKSYHLKEHTRSHLGKSLSCSLCERKCTTFGALRAHMKTHDGNRDFGCDICGCRFTTNGSLKRHMSVHSNERPLKCSICNAMFRTDQLLRRHIKLHEPRERKGKLVATNPLQLPRGRRRAAVIRLTAEETQVLAQQPLDNAATVSEKVLIASVAEKDRISELKDPDQQYNMEPIHPNQCKYCPKSFRKPSDLVRHIRIHTGERPYQCACCNKCFTVKSTLDSHLKTHGGQKLFACHVCGCLFSTKGSLKVHMRLHTGAKPFKCPLCEMRFRTSGHRKAHLMSHMKHAASGGGKLSSQLTTSARRNKQVAEQQQPEQEHESELQNPATSTTSELVTGTMTHITLDPATMSSLIPGEPFNSSLLTTAADGSHIMGNFQLQLTDGLQIAGVDTSGMLHSYTTQAVQLDEALLQQFQVQASNIIIQAAERNDQMQTHVRESNTVEDRQQQQATVDADEEMATVRFEIHTDEHGQIINIQPAMLHEIPSRNGDITFDLTGDLGMEVVEGDQQSQASRFRVTDSRKEGRTLVAVAMGNHMSDGHKDKEGGNTTEDCLLFHDCATCGKHFSKPSQLERHTRIHTGERPFTCPLCAKTFNQKNALNTHVKSHTGERPFPCPYCHYSFTQKGNLKTHMRRAHQFSSLELATSSAITVTTSIASPSAPTRSLLKPKQQSILTNLNSNVDLAAGKSLDLEKVVGDLFPQMRNTTPADP